MKIFLCCCSETGSTAIDWQKMSDQLQNAGINVIEYRNLCTLALKGELETQPEAGDIIIGCHERAMKALLTKLSIPVENITFYNLREMPVETILEEVAQKQPSCSDDNPIAESAECEVRPWYPVIDRELCTNCGQCLNFCLFGVYDRNNKKVEVAKPLNCKDGCPACARVCPHGAIIFPRHEEPAIAGQQGESGDIDAAVKTSLEKLKKQHKKNNGILKAYSERRKFKIKRRKGN